MRTSCDRKGGFATPPVVSREPARLDVDGDRNLLIATNTVSKQGLSPRKWSAPIRSPSRSGSEQLVANAGNRLVHPRSIVGSKIETLA
jgi:hypothetical protein